MAYFLELSSQLEQLGTRKAGREELQALLDLLQQPSVAVSQVKGPYVVVQEAPPTP